MIILDIINKFCEGAEKIFTSSDDITKRSNIDIHKDEVKRSRWSKNFDCIFNFSLNTKTDIQLGEEIKNMKTIELYYPNTFSWRYDGKHIEAIGLITMNKKNLGIFTRYRGQVNFIKYLRKQLLNILQYRGTTDYNYGNIIEDWIYSTGSINIDTQLYVVDIKTDYDIFKILKFSGDRIVTDVYVNELDMRYWVREINPDFFKANGFQDIKIKKLKATPEMFGKYPPCIKKLAATPKKGNYNRFLLATFLLKIHGERDAKSQFDMMLTDKERQHVNNGNCKDQWRTIVTKGYSAPSCKTMIENGWCTGDCGRPMPAFIEEEEEKEDEFSR